jgi:hypothetical protein
MFNSFGLGGVFLLINIFLQEKAALFPIIIA